MEAEQLRGSYQQALDQLLNQARPHQAHPRNARTASACLVQRRLAIFHCEERKGTLRLPVLATQYQRRRHRAGGVNKPAPRSSRARTGSWQRRGGRRRPPTSHSSQRGTTSWGAGAAAAPPAAAPPAPAQTLAWQRAPAGPGGLST